MSQSESYPQHVVTAVIVAHDGAAWLPRVADALLEQTRPVQRVVAVDTGSRDRSGAVLAAKFGQASVFGMDRATGYGAAVSRALQHRAAHAPVPGSSGFSAQDRIEWLWLLHDDCEPAPDALEQLLRGAAEATSAAVLGCKLRDWANRVVILEAGVTLDTAGRRLTGIEPREVDQGQHDGDRDALAVSSAGMLVRRDVWEQVGGLDTTMALFMEDIDFCWRVHAAGYRVRIITDAVAFHMQAAARHRRAVSVGRRVRMLDRRNGLLTLLGNLPLRQMLTSAAGNTVVSLLRIAFFLLAKRLVAALDEAAALASVLGHPVRLMGRRKRRARGRRSAYSRIRADLPPGRSVRRLMEFAASTTLSSQAVTAGAHHASADPAEDDSVLVDNGGISRRLLTSPAVLTFIALVAVALVAGRSLLGAGPLGGGALVPDWGGASDLWSGYIQAFHPSGIGSTGAQPPYLAVIAALATLVGGKPWLAIDVLLLGCVPLAGMSAMFAVRKVTGHRLVRAWAAASYALLPVAMGVVAAGRFGTAFVFVLLPIIMLLAARVLTSGGRRARRAAWATGLLVGLGAMFVPLLWLTVIGACVLAALAWRNTRQGLLVNLAIIGLSAPVLLLPWTITLASHPAGLLLEAGVPPPGTASAGIGPRSLLLLSPGGPGLPPLLVTAGLLFAALAALLAARRRKLILAGWGIAMCGLLLAIVVSRLTVIPPDGGQPVAVWAGLPLAIAAAGLLLAAAVGADAFARMLAGRTGRRALFSGPAAWIALAGLAACSAPLLAAASWVSTGVSGPVRPQSTQLVPALVAVADGQGRQVRTLVLTQSGGRVSYLLLRGPSPSLADVTVDPSPAARNALGRAVAALIAPEGGSAVAQSQLLADFDIGYVLVEAPVDQQLASVLDDVSGLRPYSTTSSYDLWQLETTPSRVTVVEPSGAVVPILSGPVGVSGARVPAAGGTLMLAEPAGGWQAALNGHPLTPVRSPAGPWAQAFKLPAGGGSLDIGYAGLGHDLLLAFQALALIMLIGLALPGIRAAEPAGQAAGADRGLAAEAGADDDQEASQAGGDQVHRRRADAGEGGRRLATLAAGAAAGRQRRRPARERAGRSQRGRGGSRRAGSRRDLAEHQVAAAPVTQRRNRAGGRRAAGTGGAAEPRVTRLADAWPYAAGDEPDDQPLEPIAGHGPQDWPEPADVGREAAGRSFSGAEIELSGAAIGGAGQDAGEPPGSWPYPDVRNEPAARRAELPGRSPSGRVPSGGWPYPEADEEAASTRYAGARPPPAPARSPSGWVPPAGRTEQERDSAPLAEEAGYRATVERPPPSAARSSGLTGYDPEAVQDATEPPSGRPDRQRAGWRRAAGRSGRSGRSAKPGHARTGPAENSGGQDERIAGAGKPGTRRRGGPDRDDLPGRADGRRFAGGRSERPAGRHGAGPAGRDADDDRLGSEQVGRRDRAARPRSGGDQADGRDSGPRDRRGGDQADRRDGRPHEVPDADRLERWDSDRPERREAYRPARPDGRDQDGPGGDYEDAEPDRYGFGRRDRPREDRWQPSGSGGPGGPEHDRPSRRDAGRVDGQDSHRRDSWDHDGPVGRRGRPGAGGRQAAGAAERRGAADESWPGGRERRGAADESWPGGRERRGAADESPGRRGRRALPAGRRGAEQPAAWLGGTADALEPLPPLDGPPQAAGGRIARRQDDRGGRTSWDVPRDSGEWRYGGGAGGRDKGGRDKGGRDKGAREKGGRDAGGHDSPGPSGWGDPYGPDDEPEPRWSMPERTPEYEGDSW